MTKSQLIDKEKKEIEAIKKVLQEQGMDPEEIERHIGKTYQVDLSNIKVEMDPLEIDEDDLPMSLRTETKKTAGMLETGSLNYSKLQHSS